MEIYIQYSYWLHSKLNFSLCMDMWLFDVMTETPYQYFKKSSHQQLKFEMSTSSFLRDLNAVKYASIVKLNYMVRGLADSQLAYSWCQRLKWNICTFLFLLKVTFLSLNLQDTVWQYSGMTLGLKHVTYIYMVAVAFSLGYILDWIQKRTIPMVFLKKVLIPYNLLLSMTGGITQFLNK